MRLLRIVLQAQASTTYEGDWHAALQVFNISCSDKRTPTFTLLKPKNPTHLSSLKLPIGVFLWLKFIMYYHV